MVGNVWEWVADWGPQPTSPPLPALFDGTEDFNFMGGASETSGPGALARGGFFGSGAVAGVFAVSGGGPSGAGIGIGFRCVR